LSVRPHDTTDWDIEEQNSGRSNKLLPAVLTASQELSHEMQMMFA